MYNLYESKNYFILTTTSKQILCHGLILQNTLKDIKFNEEACLKRVLDINTNLKIKVKKDSEKTFFHLMSISIFRNVVGRRSTDISKLSQLLEKEVL